MPYSATPGWETAASGAFEDKTPLEAIVAQPKSWGKALNVGRYDGPHGEKGESRRSDQVA